MQVDNSQRLFAQNGQLAQLSSNVSEQKALLSQMKLTNKSIELLKQLCEVDRSLNDFDVHIEQGHLVEAAEALKRVVITVHLNIFARLIFLLFVLGLLFRGRKPHSRSRL